MPDFQLGHKNYLPFHYWLEMQDCNLNYQQEKRPELKLLVVQDARTIGNYIIISIVTDNSSSRVKRR